MKKLAIFVLIIMLFAGVFSVSAQTEAEIYAEILADLTNGMEGEFQILLNGVGNDFEPILLQNALTGQNIGMAELGSEWFSHFYFSLIPTISITTANGVLEFTDSQDYEDSIIIKSLLDDLLFGETGVLSSLMNDEATAEIADILLNQATPIPAIKMNMGVALPLDLELLVNGMWVPGDLVMGVVNNADPEIGSTIEDLGISLNYVNVRGELRYVLLREGDQTSGMSIGLGGAYNNLGLEVGLGEMLGETLAGDLPEGVDNPFAAAGASFGTSVIAFGLDLNMSKRLAIFYPFLNLGAWYGITDFSGTITLIDTNGDGVKDSGDAIITGGAGTSDLSFLMSTGMDILIGPFGSNITIDYNLGSGVWGLSLGSRLQF